MLLGLLGASASFSISFSVEFDALSEELMGRFVGEVLMSRVARGEEDILSSGEMDAMGWYVRFGWVWVWLGL